MQERGNVESEQLAPTQLSQNQSAATKDCVYEVEVATTAWIARFECKQCDLDRGMLCVWCDMDARMRVWYAWVRYGSGGSEGRYL